MEYVLYKSNCINCIIVLLNQLLIELDRLSLTVVELRDEGQPTLDSLFYRSF